MSWMTARAGPGQQRRNDEPDALARSGRREGHDMFRPVMAQIAVAEPAEKHAGRPEQSGGVDLVAWSPSATSRRW